MKQQAEPITDRVIGTCPGCGAPIYESDKVWVVNGTAIHNEEYCLVKLFSPVAIRATEALVRKAG